MIAQKGKKNKLNTDLKAVDFFCGGGGLSYGFMNAGIEILAGIDFDINCQQTYEENIGARFINADITKLKENDFSEKLKLKKNDDDLILVGCSPCQFWSVINTDKTKAQKSKNLLIEFQRFVRYLKPGYVVVENVPGVLRKKKESGLEDFIDWLEKAKYQIHFKVHNVNDFGVPQHRLRFTLIANRVTKYEIEPKPMDIKLTVKDVIGQKNGFPKIKHGNRDKSDLQHITAGLEKINLERIERVRKDGGDRFDFAKIKRLQLKCFEGKDSSFRDTYGRMWWNRPSPTITTRFLSVSNGRFTHPEENRGISLREGATLQSFPRNYKFYGRTLEINARMIGNAVPPAYALQIGYAILENHFEKR